MAKSKDQKSNLVDTYKGMINKSQAMYLFSGSLKASHTSELKSKAIGNANITLLKNTLFNIAVKESGLDAEVTGYNNMMFTPDSVIENANFLSKFLSDNNFEANAVIVGGTKYEGSKLKQIAGLGSEKQVYGTLVGVMAMPMTMIVRGLQSPMQKLVYVLSQVKPS